MGAPAQRSGQGPTTTFVANTAAENPDDALTDRARAADDGAVPAASGSQRAG